MNFGETDNTDYLLTAECLWYNELMSVSNLFRLQSVQVTDVQIQRLGASLTK